MAKSLESSPEIDDDEKTTFEQRVRPGGEFSDALMGLQNRCRLFKIVRDIQRIDVAEVNETIVEEDGECAKEGLWPTV